MPAASRSERPTRTTNIASRRERAHHARGGGGELERLQGGDEYAIVDPRRPVAGQQHIPAPEKVHVHIRVVSRRRLRSR